MRKTKFQVSTQNENKKHLSKEQKYDEKLLKDESQDYIGAVRQCELVIKNDSISKK